MDLCQFFDWNLSMLTFYDFLEEFLALGVLTEEDKISTSQPNNRSQSPLCITPEPKESQILKFTQNSSGKRSVTNSHKSSLKSGNGLEVLSLAPTAKKHLIKSIHRLSLHISHFIASEFITDVTKQKEISYLIICLARKCLNIKNYKSDLLRDLYNIRISNESGFNKTLSELDIDFNEIFRYFRINFNEFDDGLGAEEEAFGPFGPFDVVEREYDTEGNSVEGQQEMYLKFQRIIKERRKNEEVSQRVRVNRSVPSSNNDIMKALNKVENSETKFKENKARRYSSELDSANVNKIPKITKIVNSGSNTRRSENDNPLRVSNKMSTRLSNKLSRSDKGSFHSFQNEDFMDTSVFSKKENKNNKNGRQRYNSFNTQKTEDIVPQPRISARKYERPDIPKPVKKITSENETQGYYKPNYYGTQNENPEIKKAKIGSYDFLPNLHPKVDEENTTEKVKTNKWKMKKHTTTPVADTIQIDDTKDKLISAYMSLPLKQQLEKVKIEDNQNTSIKVKSKRINRSNRSIDSDILRESRFIPLKGYKSDKSVKLPARIPKGSPQKSGEFLKDFLQSEKTQSGNLAYNLASSISKKPTTETEEIYSRWESRVAKKTDGKSQTTENSQFFSYNKTDTVVRIESSDKNTGLKDMTSDDIKFSSTKKTLNFRDDVKIKIEDENALDKSPGMIISSDKNSSIYILPKIEFSDAKPPKNSINSQAYESGFNLQNQAPLAAENQRSVKNSASSNHGRNPLFAKTRLSRNQRGSNETGPVRSSSYSGLRSSSHRIDLNQNIPQAGVKSISKPPGLPVYSSKKVLIDDKTDLSVYKKKRNSGEISIEPHLKNNLAKTQKKNKNRNRTVNPQSLRYYPNDDSNSLKNIKKTRNYFRSGENKHERASSNIRTRERGSNNLPPAVNLNFSTNNLFNYQSENITPATNTSKSQRNLNNIYDITKNIQGSINNTTKTGVDLFSGSYFNINHNQKTEIPNSSKENSYMRLPKDSNQALVTNHTTTSNSNFSRIIRNNHVPPSIQKDSIHIAHNHTHSYGGSIHQPSPLDFQKFINKGENPINILNSSTTNANKKSDDLRSFLNIAHGVEQKPSEPEKPIETQPTQNRIRLSKSIDHKFELTENFLNSQSNFGVKTIEPKKIQPKNFNSFNGIDEVMAANNTNTQRYKLEQSPNSFLNNTLRGSYNKVGSIINQVSSSGNNLRGSYMQNLNSLRVSKNLQNFKNQQNLQIQAIKTNPGNIRIEGDNTTTANIGSARGNIQRTQVPSNNVRHYESSRDNTLRRSNNIAFNNPIINQRNNHLIKGFYNDNRGLSKSPQKFQHVVTNNGNTTTTQNYSNNYSSNNVKKTSVPDIDKIYQQLKQKQKYTEAVKKANKSTKIALKQVMGNNNSIKGTNFDKFWLKKKGYFTGNTGGVKPNTFFVDIANQRMNTDGNSGGNSGYPRSNRIRRSGNGF